MFGLASIPRSSPIELFLWKGTSSNQTSQSAFPSFGHLALKIKNAQRGDSYISFWSGNCSCGYQGTRTNKKWGHFHTEIVDKIILTKVADYTALFFSDKIDTRKMIIIFEQLRKMSSQGLIQYRLDTTPRFYGKQGKNCASFIFYLFQEAGIKQIASNKIIDNYRKFSLAVLYAAFGSYTAGLASFLRENTVRDTFSQRTILVILSVANLSLFSLYTPEHVKNLVVEAIKGDFDAAILEKDNNKMTLSLGRKHLQAVRSSTFRTAYLFSLHTPQKAKKFIEQSLRNNPEEVVLKKSANRCTLSLASTEILLMSLPSSPNELSFSLCTRKKIDDLFIQIRGNPNTMGSKKWSSKQRSISLRLLNALFPSPFSSTTYKVSYAIKSAYLGDLIVRPLLKENPLVKVASSRFSIFAINFFDFPHLMLRLIHNYPNNILSNLSIVCSVDKIALSLLALVSPRFNSSRIYNQLALGHLLVGYGIYWLEVIKNFSGV